MSIKREHIWMAVALLAGFAIGVWYSKSTGASLVLAGMAQPESSSNGSKSIPIYGMVTAAQGVGDGSS